MTQLEEKEAVLAEEEPDEDEEVDESLAPNAFEVQHARPDDFDVNVLRERFNILLEMGLLALLVC